MEKVICDICATAYSATADVCPICGYPRQGDAKIVNETDDDSTAVVEREKIKGGRFSNKNVKKRQKEALAAAKASAAAAAAPAAPVAPVAPAAPVSPAAPAVPAAEPEDDEPEMDDLEADELEAEPDQEPEKESNPNTTLLLIAVILMAAIVLVTAYIAVRFFWAGNPQKPEQTTTAATTTAPVQTTESGQIACAALNVDAGDLKLDAVGKEYRLRVTAIPANTTDVVTFASSDETVARVSADGVVTAVGAGKADITITCGQVEVVCSVLCDIPEPTTVPTTVPTDPTTQTTVPVETTTPTSGELTLSHTDVTLFSEGESFTISVKEGDNVVSRIKVEWSSSDETIAAVENGVVTAVAPGTAKITASYNGKEASCVVRCNYETDDPEPDPEATTDAESDDGQWTISHEDVTLSIGEKFTLKIKNSAGETANVTWSVSEDGIVSISGNTVEALASGTVTVSATVDGVEYKCIVRVRSPE